MATKITLRRADKENLVSFVKDEQRTRANSTFRKDKERVWRELDRQIAMQPPVAQNRSQGGIEEDWHNAIQLGHLADALEIRAADVMRLAFPVERKWFWPHVEIPTELDEAGNPLPPDQKEQRQKDGMLRSLMAQQHADFGLRDRVKLSVVEALKHGGFVAVAKWGTQKKFHDGSRLETLSAPVWDVFSMWDCFPDPSPEVQGTDLFYQGSMITTKKMRATKARKMPGWRTKDIQEDKHGMTDITYFWGDAVITRSQSDLWFPNRYIVISGDKVVYTAVFDLPYSPVIYTGYEKDDPRDPYYTSPLIKRSPSLQIANRSANKFLDAVDLATEPPMEYDRTSYMNGEPDNSPGAVNEISGGQGSRVMNVADPQAALQGLQLGIQHVEQGVGVDQIRAGIAPGTEQTAFEVNTVQQRAEVREVEFVGVLERQGLLPFLYMQHDLNKQKLENYPVYNEERTTPDFIRIDSGDLKKHAGDGVRFEITGSKQILGEIQRSQRFLEVNGFVLQQPDLAARVDVDEILLQAYADTGMKDPERFILNTDDDEEQRIQQAIEQTQQAMMEEVQPQIDRLQQQLAQAQAQQEVGMQRVQTEAQLKAQDQQLKAQEAQAEQQRKDEEMRLEQQRKDEEMRREQDRRDAESQAKIAETQARIDQQDALTDQKIRSAEVDAVTKARHKEEDRAKESAPKEEKVINVNTGGGSKVVTLTRSGNQTQAVVRSTEE